MGTKCGGVGYYICFVFDSREIIDTPAEPFPKIHPISDLSSADGMLQWCIQGAYIRPK